MKLKKYIPIVIMLCLVAGAAALMLAGDGVTVEMLTNYAPKNTALAVVVALLAYAVKSQTVFVLYGGVATAVGIVKTAASILMLVTVNAAAKKLSDTSLF